MNRRVSDRREYPAPILVPIPLAMPATLLEVAASEDELDEELDVEDGVDDFADAAGLRFTVTLRGECISVQTRACGT